MPTQTLLRSMRSSTPILVVECFLFPGWHQDSQKKERNSYEFVHTEVSKVLFDSTSFTTFGLQHTARKRTMGNLLELGNLDHNAIQ